MNRKSELLLRCLAEAVPGAVVEVGSLRFTQEVATDGYATVFLAEHCKQQGIPFFSLEIDPTRASAASAHLAELGLPASVVCGDAAAALSAIDRVSLLYLDGSDCPREALCQFNTASLQAGSLLLVDDCQEYGGNPLGKGTLVAQRLHELGISFELIETEPGFRALKAIIPRDLNGEQPPSRRRLRVNVITNIDNGVGLQREAYLLAGLLTELGHEPNLVHFQRHSAIRDADINIFDEVVDCRLLRFARRNWVFPHPEWWFWDHVLDKFDLVLAKTQDCFLQFKNKTERVAYTGFLSNDHYQASIPRERKFLHIQGASQFKNTAAIIDAWRRYKPDAPLTIVSATDYAESIGNVTFLGRVSDEDLIRLQNSHLFHLCPSEYEGWGHYLHEGLGVGAVVVTTDAAPMNETACPAALRIAVDSQYHRNAAVMSRVASPSVALSVRNCLNLTSEELETTQANGRQAFLAEKSLFKIAFANLLDAAFRPRLRVLSKAKPSRVAASDSAIGMAIMSVPRQPSYVEQTIASLLLSSPGDRQRVNLMVGNSDEMYLSNLAQHNRIDIRRLPNEEWDSIRDWSVHRRLAYNLWHTLTRAPTAELGICVCEDDIIFADGFLGKLRETVDEIRARESPKFVLAAYSHFDYAAEPSRSRGMYYCSYNASAHYGNCCVYVSEPLRQELAAYILANSATTPGAPADIALGQYCEELWRRGEGGMYQTVSSLAQHVGVVSGGTSGQFSASPTFGRQWPS